MFDVRHPSAVDERAEGSRGSLDPEGETVFLIGTDRQLNGADILSVFSPETERHAAVDMIRRLDRLKTLPFHHPEGRRSVRRVQTDLLRIRLLQEFQLRLFELEGVRSFPFRLKTDRTDSFLSMKIKRPDTPRFRGRIGRHELFSDPDLQRILPSPRRPV